MGTLKEFRIVITGRPGVGKSTMVKLAVELLKEHGARVVGFYTEEIRDESGRRVGFDVVDVESQERFALARKGKDAERKLGSYGVMVKEFESYLTGLEKRIDSAEVVVVDELGPMEFFSRKFVELMKRVAEMKRWIITHHFRAKNYQVVRNFLERATWKCALTPENRDEKMEVLLKLLQTSLEI